MPTRRTIPTSAASVAATTGLLLAGGALFGVPFVGAAVDTGERPVFVAVDPPVRILDTRKASGVTAGAPVGAGQTLELAVTGAAGVPADATSVQLNVTVEQGTAPSFLSLWPEGAWPGTSTLNWTDASPRPNGSTVGIGADGKVRILNYAGTVHVIVDVTGYYFDHTHDDRYYTEAEVDAAIAAHAARRCTRPSSRTATLPSRLPVSRPAHRSPPATTTSTSRATSPAAGSRPRGLRSTRGRSATASSSSTTRQRSAGSRCPSD